MKRISTVVVATALAALVLTGCSTEPEPEAAGPQTTTADRTTQPSPTAQTPDATSTTSATATDTAPVEPDPDDDTPAATPSDTTCGEFAELNEAGQQQLIDRILADHPDSTFTGNPSAALGTAKLVCNASDLADQKVAVVSGILDR